MPNLTTTSTGISSQPGWYQNALQQLIRSAETTAAQPYVPYPGPRIAGFTPAQQQAFGLTQANVGAYQPYFQQAGQGYATGLNPQLNQGVFQSYMNPYVSDVVNRIQQLGVRNLQENVLPGVNQTFTSAGQFGSSRNADFTNRAMRDTQEAISAAQGQALASGFQNQVQNTQNAIGQAMQAGQLEQGLGTATQAAGLTDASAMAAIGQQQQNLGQQSLNLGYQDFLTQQQWPYQQETYLSSILGGAQVPQTQQTTQTQPGPSTTAQILGGLAGTVGLLGATNAFTNAAGTGAGWLTNAVSGLFAEGGSVPHLAGGGAGQRGPRPKTDDWLSSAADYISSIPLVDRTYGGLQWQDAYGMWHPGLPEGYLPLDWSGSPPIDRLRDRWMNETYPDLTNPSAEELKARQAREDAAQAAQDAQANRDWYRGFEGIRRWDTPRPGQGEGAYTMAGGGPVLLALGGLPRMSGGFSAPKIPTPSIPKAPGVARPRAPTARRPRFGGIASRRIGGIGMMPGGGVSGVLPGSPAGVMGRLPGAMSPGAASVIRGLSGSPASTAAPRLI